MTITSSLLRLASTVAKRGARCGGQGTGNQQQHREVFNNGGRSYFQTISLQLDYYMSAQFAGIACALTNDMYKPIGGIEFLPICPVGLEMSRVREHFNKNRSNITIGSVEQNIFTPLLYRNQDLLNVKAVAAMFRKSPLALASLPSSKKITTVGAHEDTVELLQRIYPDRIIRPSPRPTKIEDLKSGKYDSIQVYTTTEVLKLRRQWSDVRVENLEGAHGCKLGYSQVLFAPEESLSNNDHREVIQSFLDITFKGWEMAVHDPRLAAECVKEARKILALDEENNDHWDDSLEYHEESVRLCGDFVKETYQGDRYGVISSERWNDATKWLLSSEKNNDTTSIGKNFGFDSTIWQSPAKLLAGGELARKTLENASESAREFRRVYGRKPSLAVITVGQLDRYTHGQRRLQLYSNPQCSWFNKSSVGKSNGFDVHEINLPVSTTTDELLSKLYSLKDVDGIQLMWPLPEHIDSAKVYRVIDIERDVDGAHYIGQVELGAGGALSSLPLPPVTPAAAMALMDEYNVELKNKQVLVVGRSRIVGSPLAQMLRHRGALVTVAHSDTSQEKLRELVRTSEVIIAAAGQPGLLKTTWVKPGTQVVNIGTTFDEAQDALVSDFDGDLSAVADRYSPVPGGIGPLSTAFLFKNVADSAWHQAEAKIQVNLTWEKKSGVLRRSFHFPSYDDALEFANRLNNLSTIMNHHPNLQFTHHCVNGVTLTLEYFTFEANEITGKDYVAAKVVNEMLGGKEVCMSDYSYNLKEESIAKYPADPRGSSKLLHVDESSIVTKFKNFSEAIINVAAGAYFVFNESKVAKARLTVVDSESKRSLEMMILDIGDIADRQSNEVTYTVMLRQDDVQVGEEFVDTKSGKFTFRVVNVLGNWIEDRKSNGNGTECIVECLSTEILTVADLLHAIGSVPIPPYLQRPAEESDSTSYNNVYASLIGSVAAPTAGLHFTDEVLRQIGSNNTIFLSLHVGAGTFKPVTVSNALKHEMHGENFSVSVAELRRIIEVLENQERLIVVGTTTARTLESLYWIGIKILLGIDSSDGDVLELGQDDWRVLQHIGGTVVPSQALHAVIRNKKDFDDIRGRTRLLITPDGYEFRVVNELITNFHAPDSTLMLLVSAFLGGGSKVKKIYEDAQDSGFRFLSYGDVCLFCKASQYRSSRPEVLK